MKKPAIGVLALAFTFPSLMAQVPEASFSERVEVTVRTVTAVLTRADGKPLATPPDPAQLEVREDGRRCEVLGIEPAIARPVERSVSPGVEALPGVAPREPEPRPRPRRQALYVDAGFLRTRSVREVANAFREQADALVALGPVEIVVADPQPKGFLAPTRDAGVLRTALDRLAKEVPGRTASWPSGGTRARRVGA